MSPTVTPHTHLSVYSNAAGRRVWTAFYRGNMACSVMLTRAEAEAALAHWGASAPFAVYDGDIGEFISATERQEGGEA
jgi:hypothetical protein